MAKNLLLFLIAALLQACSHYSKHQIVEADASGNAREVIAYLEELIEKDNSNYQIYFQRAKIYYELEDYQKALTDIQKSLELSPTDQESYLLLSQVYNQLNNTEESINAALQAEQRGFRNYELYKLLSLNYLTIGEVDNAEKSIDRLLEFSYTAENLSLKGDIYLELKDTATAINSYNESMKLDKRLSRPYQSLYNIYKHKDSLLAESFIDSYLKVNPENRDFLLLKSHELTQRQEYDSALEMYKRARYSEDGRTSILNKVAQLYFSSAKYDTALFESRKSLSIDSVNNREAVLLSARSLDKLRDYDMSKLYYEALVQQDSTDVIALEELS